MTIQKAIECKHADFSTAVTVSTLGSFHDLTAIPLGDTDVQRDGDKLTISSIMIRGEISAGDVPYNNLRMRILPIRTGFSGSSRRNNISNGSVPQSTPFMVL
jgi:hypothetical protein